MRKMKMSELCSLEVINLCGGERLGYPTDLEIDLECRSIVSITVTAESGLSLFDKKEDIILPWCKIECIGEDAILVRVERQELPSFCACRPRKKWR